MDGDTVVGGFLEGGSDDEKAALKKLAEVCSSHTSPSILPNIVHHHLLSLVMTRSRSVDSCVRGLGREHAV